ncbi:hypothetical protein MBAV_005087 [Candidatus Magnetobacterium bavaricum]|uniref:Uncharacterized protein n=1 Tax=Candidatus Magnetobacterium bavaricum TaxID=29290 RepID=A0A0F3GLC5_9BACT|nr:hypothetical protein MBAV_005087 [Candidatus Magnetobacterium bavaricum]
MWIVCLNDNVISICNKQFAFNLILRRLQEINFALYYYYTYNFAVFFNRIRNIIAWQL